MQSPEGGPERGQGRWGLTPQESREQPSEEAEELRLCTPPH